MESKVLILDFGSQYTQLIARRVRELGVYSEILPCTTKYLPEKGEHLSALILSGGPESVLEAGKIEFDQRWLECNVPVLGICYGMQLLAQHFGGTVQASTRREYGPAVITPLEESPFMSGVQSSTVWMSHGDHVESVPDGFTVAARSEDQIVAVMCSEQRKIYGLQFHPEVAHTTAGTQFLKNFLFTLAEVEKDWSAESFIHETIASISAEVPAESQVICGLSGGVDSTVAAVLVHRAIGERLHCIFVDNGLLRGGEAQQVMDALGPKGLGLPVTKVDASALFLKELEGVVDPEQKRKIIGRVFIEVFEEAATKIRGADFLVQGTLYPDVIESVSTFGPSHTIKSHHNVGGLPEKMNLKLIEPLRELFKDEVRRFGEELEIPRELLWRQPFPGPGLAVRVLGDITQERLEVLRQADRIFQEEIVRAGMYDQIWQAFTVLLPIQSVGVMGDQRTYEQAAVLRAVTSQDGMTADWAELPRELLSRTSSRIINEVRGINRVAYDISSKPPATIEWE